MIDDDFCAGAGSANEAAIVPADALADRSRQFAAFLEKCWIGLVLWMLFAVLIALGWSWLVGGLQPVIAAFSLAGGAAAALLSLFWIARRSPAPDLPETVALHDSGWFWRWLVRASWLLFSLRAFLWLIFEKNGQYNVLSPNNLGDLPKHIQYIRFLAGGAAFWPVNPLHAHSTIGYSFGTDLFNALLECCGVPLLQGLIGCGLLAALLTGVALHRWGGTFGLAAFLFNGGLAGSLFFFTGHWIDYQQTVDWKSLPLAILVTQRGFLYALPAGLLLLLHWRKIYAAPNATPALAAPSLPLVLEWLLYATMPLFHLHTFLFLSLLLGTLAVFGHRRGRAWLIIALSVLPATTLVWLLTDHFHSGSHLAWQPGWMQGAHFSWIYWVNNFGLLPLFWLALPIVLLWRGRSVENRAALLLVLPALLLFIATLFVKFAPWAWDNTKLMLWSYVVLMPYVWSKIVAPSPPLIRATICLTLFFSGFLSLWGGLGPQFTGYPLVGVSEVADVGQAVQNLPRESIFACAPDYAHPLVFNGRRLAVAYTGHLAGHGISYWREERSLNQLMNGAPEWREAGTFLGARYIFWGSAEKKLWPHSLRPWALPENRIASGSWGEIYRFGR